VIPYGLLDKVNFTVNKYLTYIPDGADTSWKVAHETEASRRGDCEDYAIVKASRLVNLHDQNPDDMEIGIFITRKGNAHAMLICKSERTTGFFRREKTPCDFVLDNRTNGIYTMDQISDKLSHTKKVDAYL
jgi:predicted transglutaminase-like cysteine proteinase